MANKTLTASVKLNTSDFEAKLKRIAKSIDALNNRVGNQQSAYNAVNSALKQTTSQTTKVKNETDKWKRSVDGVNKSSNRLMSTVKQLAATYLGVMGAKAVINTSDTVTSSENKLNALNGYNSSLTQDTMNKIYSASQRSRSSYTDMMSNVSKSMTLASDAFQGNVDNAIRFQEIMAKSYKIGGASEAEASSSMYQLVQALGSGVLQGDELRSVREGAPLAYKAIEKFCQGVLNTDQSLKDLASQGVITSNMVVAAIMDMENGADNINDKFAKTKATFADTWNIIKNTAVKTFEPMLQKLNSYLNSERGQKAIQSICNALAMLAEVLIFVFDLFGRFFNWCADNWEWLKYIIIGAIVVIIAYYAKLAAAAVASAIKSALAFVKTHWALLLIVAAVMAILYVYELWRQGTITTTEAIVYCLAIIAAAALIAGIVLNAMWLVWVAIAILVVAVVIALFAELCGVINVVVQAIVNSWYWCGNVIFGIGESIKAICTNIGIAFQNAWTWAKNTFWEFIADVLRGVSKLEPVINGIAGLLGGEGVDFGGLIDDIEGKKGEYKSFVSVSDAWKKGYNTYDTFQDGWASDAYNAGYEWGASGIEALNEWGSQFQGDGSGGLLSGLGEKLGLSGLGSGSSLLGDSYDPSGANDDIADALKKINGDTGDIADSMDLTQEDLEYLRRVADMEWKKEFTTASITVDMSNYNTINGEGDLDGIVDMLADKLYEEMNAVANGVYN